MHLIFSNLDLYPLEAKVLFYTTITFSIAERYDHNPELTLTHTHSLSLSLSLERRKYRWGHHYILGYVGRKENIGYVLKDTSYITYIELLGTYRREPLLHPGLT